MNFEMHIALHALVVIHMLQADTAQGLLQLLAGWQPATHTVADYSSVTHGIGTVTDIPDSILRSLYYYTDTWWYPT